MKNINQGELKTLSNECHNIVDSACELAYIESHFRREKNSQQILEDFLEKYINELKLSRSKQLIKENKYTISEIAFMLGFNSIHYFSRTFTQHYEISPSEYAKTIFKS